MQTGGCATVAKLLNGCRIPHLSVSQMVSKSVSQGGKHDENASAVSVLPECCGSGRLHLSLQGVQFESLAQTVGLKQSCLPWLEICDVRQINVRLWEKEVFYSNLLKSYPRTKVV